MLRQYAPPRFRYETIRGRTLAVGTVPIGEVFRYAPSRAAAPRTYIVEAWMTRAYARADRRGRFSYLARGGHLALVRDLATGRQTMLADAIIRACLDRDPPTRCG
jgi:hypothetical protein